MEGINGQILGIIDEMTMLQSNKMKMTDPEQKTDPYGYPYEAFDAFSMEPLSFQERSMRLHVQANELFGMMRTYNRHSPLYLRTGIQLERMINQLGSCCITKAVMEQQGSYFPFLRDLTIEVLRSMTAFAFRKCHSAILELGSLGRVNIGMSNLSVRLSALDRRLEKTEEKIRKIKSGEIRAEDLITDRTEKPAEKAEHTESKPADTIRSMTASARALPIDRAAIAQVGPDTVPVSAEPDAKQAAVIEAAPFMPWGYEDEDFEDEDSEAEVSPYPLEELNKIVPRFPPGMLEMMKNCWQAPAGAVRDQDPVFMPP